MRLSSQSLAGFGIPPPSPSVASFLCNHLVCSCFFCTYSSFRPPRSAFFPTFFGFLPRLIRQRDVGDPLLLSDLPRRPPLFRVSITPFFPGSKVAPPPLVFSFPFPPFLPCTELGVVSPLPSLAMKETLSHSIDIQVFKFCSV